MGYLHINNLYKDQTVLMFKECYALEKIHGTSAHISYDPATLELKYFSGGESHERFVGLFDGMKLRTGFTGLTLPPDKKITVYGEAYGGKQQGMSATYGKDLKFIAFDVEIGERWLDVPSAEAIVKSLGLEFVSYEKVLTELTFLDTLRDAPSVQAVRNGITEPKPREGIVLRPLIEVTLNNGNRVIAKHKGEAFQETATPRKIELDPAKLELMANANAIANEWVTPMRLIHVLDKIPDHDMTKMVQILTAMEEDVLREGSGEIDLSVDAFRIKKAIKTKCATMYKEYLQGKLHESS